MSSELPIPPKDSPLTAEQKLEIHDFVGATVRYWSAFLGIASFVGLLASLAYVFFVLPGKAFEEASAQFTRFMQTKAEMLDQRLAVLDRSMIAAELKIAGFNTLLEKSAGALNDTEARRKMVDATIAASGSDALKLRGAFSELEKEIAAAKAELAALKISKEESGEIANFLVRYRAATDESQRGFALFREQISELVLQTIDRQEKEERLGALRSDLKKYSALVKKKGITVAQKKTYNEKVSRLNEDIKNLVGEIKSEDDAEEKLVALNP